MVTAAARSSFLSSALVVAGLALPARAFAQPGDTPQALPPLPPPTSEPFLYEPPSPAPPPPSPSPTPPPSIAPALPGDATRTSQPAAEASDAWTLGGTPTVLVLTIGLGLSLAAAGDSDASGEGVYGQAEYDLVPTRWVRGGVYGGFLSTSPDASTCGGPMPTPCNASASIGFVGTKVRFTAPIPYVGLFIETGVGASAGVMTTWTSTVHKSFSGVAPHVSFAFGFSIGNAHRYFADIAFTYLAHPEQSQVDGALAVSLTLPLR